MIYGIDDGERIRGCGMTFTAIHTPGHTQGSVCFRLDVDGEAPILFSGDHLFQGSIGRTDLPGGSYEQLMASMAEKILPLPDETHVLPGHGGTTTVGWERRDEPVPHRAAVVTTSRDSRAVPEAGLEPARPCGQRLLRPPCLPFHHSGVEARQRIHPYRQVTREPEKLPAP